MIAVVVAAALFFCLVASYKSQHIRIQENEIKQFKPELDGFMFWVDAG